MTNNNTEPNKISFRETSSAIDNISYYPTQLRLIIEFKKGRSYEYSPVSGELYHGLFLADSVGKYVRENIIKNKEITVKRVEAAAVTPGSINSIEKV